MPTTNNIRVQLAKNRTNAKALVCQLPDVDRVSMSYIEQGRVLPTKQALCAMTEALHCYVKDLYDLNDIDLTGALTTVNDRKRPLTTDHGHDGMERIYIWYSEGGKEALFEVIKQLDYPSVAEWFRDMARITFLKAAKLDGQTLHEAAAGKENE